MLICLEGGGVLGLHDFLYVTLILGWREYKICLVLFFLVICAMVQYLSMILLYSFSLLIMRHIIFLHA
jgi:hypothetical protein